MRFPSRHFDVLLQLGVLLGLRYQWASDEEMRMLSPLQLLAVSIHPGTGVNKPHPPERMGP